MSKRQWAWSWQAVSNIAVLVGVLLVVLQLRQNADLLEMQLMKQEAESYIQNFAEILPENFTQTWIKAIEDPQALSRKEIFEVDIYLWARSVARWRAMYQLAERGLLDDSEWRRWVVEDAPSALAYPFGRAWWEGIKDWGETTLPDELVDAIDHSLDQTSPNAVSGWIDELESRAGINREATPPISPDVFDGENPAN